MQKRYLTLLIATALFASACTKETKPEPKAQKEQTVEHVSQNEAKSELVAPSEQSSPLSIDKKQQVTEDAELAAKAMAERKPTIELSAQDNQKKQSAPEQIAQQTAPAVPTTSTTIDREAQTCRATTDSEVAALFDRWNASLQTGKSDIVVANYAADSILLPTVSNKVRHSSAEKTDYFNHFLENKPAGKINERFIKIGCNTALDAGIYTFHFAKTGKSVTGRYSFTYEWNGDKWLITSHHSSVMPEQAAEPSKTEHAGKEAVH